MLFDAPLSVLASLADEVQHLDSGRFFCSPGEKTSCVSVTGLLRYLSVHDDFPGDCHCRSHPAPVWSSPVDQLLPVATGIAILCTEGKKWGDTRVLRGCAAFCGFTAPISPGSVSIPAPEVG